MRLAVTTPAAREPSFADPAHNRARVDASRRPRLPLARRNSATPVTDGFGAASGGHQITFGPGGPAARSPRTSLSNVCSAMSAAKPATPSGHATARRFE